MQSTTIWEALTDGMNIWTALAKHTNIWTAAITENINNWAALVYLCDTAAVEEEGSNPLPANEGWTVQDPQLVTIQVERGRVHRDQGGDRGVVPAQFVMQFSSQFIYFDSGGKCISFLIVKCSVADPDWLSIFGNYEKRIFGTGTNYLPFSSS